MQNRVGEHHFQASASQPEAFSIPPMLRYALFFLLAFLHIGCEETASQQTPDWTQGETKSGSSILKNTPKPKVTPSGEYRFVAYNIKNYLKMWRYKDGKRQLLGKPADEITQLVSAIKETSPDILGLCEIGNLDDLKKLQSELAESGINLPHYYHTGGSDEVRQLAILSKFPIQENPRPEIQYQMGEEKFTVLRGITDATVAVPSGPIRFLGIHFKSKRPSSEMDQETVRRNEAFTLRRHLTKLHSEAKTASERMIVYGDFNDTTRSATLKAVSGSSRTKAYFKPIDLSDKYGLNWTHHWGYQDVYSRFDFILANKAMMPYVRHDKSYILDTTPYPKASDHRPLVLVFE